MLQISGSAPRNRPQPVDHRVVHTVRQHRLPPWQHLRVREQCHRWLTTTYLHTSGTESDGAVDWLFLHDGAGYARVTAYISATRVTATVVMRLPTTSATTRWSEGAWSNQARTPARRHVLRGPPVVRRLDQSACRPCGPACRGLRGTTSTAPTTTTALNYTINTQDMNTIEVARPDRGAGHRHGQRRVHPERRPDQ